MQTKTRKKPASALSERKKVLTLYVLFYGMIFLSFVTPPQAAVLSLMMCILILAGIYSIRAQVDEDTVLESHCTFLIRTFWRANLLVLYSVMICLAYLLILTDYGALMPCFHFIAEHWTSMAQNWQMAQYSKLLSGCTFTFYKANQVNVVIAGTVLILPSALYLVYRFYHGWRHAVRGLRIANR